jgi:hypothetical protein
MKPDTTPILAGSGVTAWLTIDHAASWIGLAVGLLTLVVLVQRIWINCRALKSDSSPPN